MSDGWSPPRARQKTSHVPPFVPTGTRRQLNPLRRVLLVGLSGGEGRPSGDVGNWMGLGGDCYLNGERPPTLVFIIANALHVSSFFLFLYCRVCVAVGDIFDG